MAFFVLFDTFFTVYAFYGKLPFLMIFSFAFHNFCFHSSAKTICKLIWIKLTFIHVLNNYLSRVGAPWMERFWDIVYHSFFSTIFFFRLLYCDVTFDVLWLEPKGKMTKNFCHSWSFCPFFFTCRGVPFMEHTDI